MESGISEKKMTGNGKRMNETRPGNQRRQKKNSVKGTRKFKEWAQVLTHTFPPCSL